MSNPRSAKDRLLHELACLISDAAERMTDAEFKAAEAATNAIYKRVRDRIEASR